MPRLHALELVLDDDGGAAVLADWRLLREAGLPSMLDHTGATNTPHVTVLSAPAISADVERLAADVVGPLLPGPFRAAGLAVLGGVRVSLVRLVDVPDAVTAAVLRLRAAVPDARHPGWLPHVTLARRLPRADLPRAFEVLGHDDVELTCDVLRRWDPEAEAVRTVAPAVGRDGQQVHQGM